jgi:excisionase family DNA binding protein
MLAACAAECRISVAIPWLIPRRTGKCAGTIASMVMVQPPGDEHGLDPAAHCTTVEAARRLGLAVRSVQLMVDRGELVAWKTAGGHRRISRESLDKWIAQRVHGGAAPPAAARPHAQTLDPAVPRVLLIEDSVHYQNLVSRIVRQHFPAVELHVADDGLAGLALYGRILPRVLIVDILLPGIDGATLIMSLRSHEQFAGSRLIVVTSLDQAQLADYELALSGVPVVHKPRLVADLPVLLERSLAPAPQAAAT